MTVQATDQERQRLLDDWLAWVNRIVDDVERWAQARGWATHRDVKDMEEDALGIYTAPFLRVRTPNGELHVDPIALRIMGGGDGRVDLQGWPSLNRVMLIRHPDRIEFLSESGAVLQRTWNYETFLQLAKDLNEP